MTNRNLSIDRSVNKLKENSFSLMKSLLLITVFTLLGFYTTKAQYTATWALTTDKTVVVAGAQSANVNASDMLPGTVFAPLGGHNIDGYKCAIPTSPWPNAITDGYNIDFPLSPVGANDLTITGLTFTARTSGGSGNNLLTLAYQVDGAGAWIPFGTIQTANSGGTTAIDFGALNTVFGYGHTYSVRIYTYSSLSNTSTSRKFYLKNVVFTGTTAPGGPAPTVQTTAAAATGRNTGTASGNITDGGISGVSTSGICWSTTANPTIALSTLTNNGPTTGTYTHPITGLQANTLYHVRAYATNAVGTSYGDDLTFTTDPAVIPVLTTTPASNVTIFTAVSGGNITNEGGATVTVRGICWATTPNPTLANNVTTDGTGAGSFTSNLTGLLPSTTYFVRSYATNSIGTGYGNEISFTTPPPTPTLFTTPTLLDFGNILQNTNSAPQSFSLTGFYLNPASDNITITAPTGFRVSLNSTGVFYPSIQVPYTGGSLAATTIYVRFSPTQVRTYDDSVRSVSPGASTAFVRVRGVGLPVGLQSGQGFSNKGKEFWVGYSATEKFYSDNSQDLRFTFSNTNNVPATVTIAMPNIPTFTPLVYTVPANSSITTNGNEIPESGIEDARLLNEGVYTSGIKISSDTDIVVYCHAITSAVYAATVLFPTPTLGKEYTSLNFNQRSNNSNGKSNLFVIATEDNTTIEVTLPAGVETDTHAAGSTFTQVLNKGEVLNLFGKAIGRPNLYTGNDLSGTVVKSISTTGSCKPFAMFSGSSKITIDCDNGSSGSGDNLLQQVFPKQAWGNKVIAIPTLPLIYNFYRVLVGDPATVVKRNGVALTGLINNKYYEYKNDAGTVDVLEGDKPIMVAQYMTTHNECNNPGAVGDPDMIYLSSLQQTIDTISFVSSPLGTSGGRAHYLNVAIPTSGVADFKLDGVLQGAAFAPVSFDPSTSYAQLSVTEGFHRLTSVSGFNATAYGVANDESYGYNAGTNVKNLLTGFSLQNQFGTGTSSNACRNNEFFVRVTLSYKPLSLVWNFNNNPNLTPNATFTQTNPIPEDSFMVNNQMLYVFKNPTTYLYNLVGQVPVTVTATSPIPDGCNGEQVLSFSVNVIQGPTASFTYTNTSGCLNPISFTDNAAGNGLNLDLWQWSFGDPGSGASNTSILQSPQHTFSTGGTFTVTQHIVTLEGCYDDSTVTISLSSQPVAAFSAAAQGCQGQAINFTNTSTIASGNISQWTWNFGDASPVVVSNNGNAQTHTYNNPGTYNVTLTVVSSTGCSSSTTTNSITINALPVVGFTPLTSVCTTTPPITLTGGTPASVVGIGTGVYTGTGVTGGIFNPATAGAGTFTITYTYTTALGCVNTSTSSILVTPAFNLAISSVAPLCVNDGSVTLTPSIAGGIFTGVGMSGTDFDPSVSGVGTFTINYSIPGNDCSIPASLQIQVNPIPTVDAGSPVTMLLGHPVTLTGVSSAGTYLWSPASDLSSPQTLSTQANPANTTVYTLTTTNSFGCKASDDVTVNVTIPCLDPANIFTPNQDGYFDKWTVYNGSCISNVVVDVYNRWGGLVYHSDHYTNDWDGTSKNKPLPDATYYYVIKATLIGNVQNTVRGNVTIMR